MKISTEYNSAALQVGEERAIELIAEAGFDCFDLSLFSMARVNWETAAQPPSRTPRRNRIQRGWSRRGIGTVYPRRAWRVGQDRG